MPSAFYDTNIFIYAARPELDPRDEHKRPAACELVEKGNYGLSGQVLAEFYHNTVRKGASRLSEEQAEWWLDELSSRPCADVDAVLVREGVAFSRRYQLSYWDGAIIAAAHRLDAHELYTEDLNDGQIYGTVKVINPFKSSNH